MKAMIPSDTIPSGTVRSEDAIPAVDGVPEDAARVDGTESRVGSSMEVAGASPLDDGAQGNSWWRRRGRKAFTEWALALTVVSFFWSVLPLATDDPFRWPLVLLPLVVVALRAVAREGRRLTAGRSGVGWALGAGLLVLTVGRERLGLVSIDSILAMAWAALLAMTVARVLLDLRPLLGRRLPKRPALVFWFFPWIVYLAVLPWTATQRGPDGDEPYYLLVTHSLAYDLDTDLANNYEADAYRVVGRPLEPQPGDPEGPNGEIRSRHNALLPLVLVPAYRVAGRWGVMLLLAACAAYVAWAMLRLAAHYAPRRPGAALLAYGVLAFASPLLLFSSQVWVEVPAAALFVFSLDRLLILRRRSWDVWQGLLFLVPVALLPMLKLRFVLVSVPLLLLAALRTRPSRRVVSSLVAGLVAVLAAVALFNWWRFGHPLKMYRLDDLETLLSSPAAFARGGLGVFFDVAFGLLGAAPVWWLLLPGLALALWRRWALVGDSLLLCGPYLLALAPRIEWFGGWSPPFRYPLVLLPVLALFLMPALADRKRPALGWVASGLLLVTVLAMVTWVAVPGWTYNFADGRSLWLDSASSRLGVDMARWFPSTVRPRLATWLWPLLSLLALPLLARGRWRRPATSAAIATSMLAVGLVAAVGLTKAPTRVIEPEDPWVRTDGGGRFPSTWTVQRVSYRGGWRVHGGGSFQAPVVPGGERVTLRLEVRAAHGENFHPLRVLAGETLLATHVVRGPTWQTVEVGPVDWPLDEPPLVVTGRQGAKDWRGGVVVDRVILDWQSRADVVQRAGGAPGG